MTMPPRPIAAASSLLILAAIAWAHPDDPKDKDIQPPYVGPGYRAAVPGPVPDFATEGVVLQSWMPIGEFDEVSEGANDCWGYVSPSGREYAILGLRCGTGFAEITDPANAQFVGWISGNCCTWRDIKVYGTYAYIVSECGPAVQVVDLSNIDNGTIVQRPDITAGGSASHNVAIDVASGFLYRTGGSGNGLIIFDLNVDPENPPIVGDWSERYVHDAQVVTFTDGPNAGRQIAFCCSGFNGGWVEPGLDILDVTDKGAIVQVARFLYPNGVYSHQGWLSADAQLFYLGDELDENGSLPTTTHVINVGHLATPYLAGTFTNGSSAVGHNLYTRGRYIFEANYSSGLRVFDALDPISPIEIAYFDSRPENDDANYQGLWSTYPYFPSGTVIGSDRQRGLFVWQVDLPTVVGDLDGDGLVGFLDLLEMLSAWGPCLGCPADLDGNGTVDFSDLVTLLSAWTG